MKYLLSAVCLVCLVGCVTPAEVHSFDNSRLTEKSFDQTWTSVVQHFAKNNVPIKTIEKDSGIIVAENVITSYKDLEFFASCATGAWLTKVSGVMTYNVFVSEQGSKTKVEVNTNFKRSYRSGLDTQYQTDTCNSNGKAETSLLDQIVG